MSWRRALLYWLCFLGLTAYYVAAVRRPTEQAAAHLTRAAFIEMAEGRLTALELRRGGAVVRCRRVEGRWQVVEPAGSKVPSDLVAALATNLTQLPDVEVVADASAAAPSDLTQFGLQPPVSELLLTPNAGRPLTVRLGARNPSGTAVYAQRDDSPSVFLIGLNVRYYEDLLFEAAGAPGSR